MILTTAFDYKPEDTQIFEKSLKATGYKDELIIVRGLALDVLPINSARYLEYNEILQDYDDEQQVLLLDMRDIVFQKNPAKTLPSDGLHVYCEDEGKTIGDCQFNSIWFKQAFGIEKFEKVKHNRIICAGTIIGGLSYIKLFVAKLVETLLSINRYHGLDQAAVNCLVYDGYPAIIHDNFDGVYTLGYVPEEDIVIDGDNLVNRGGIPTIVHQYDRHKVLNDFYSAKYYENN